MEGIIFLLFLVNHHFHLYNTLLNIEQICRLSLIYLLSFQLVIGMDDPNDPSISIKDALNDEKRIKYHNDYLSNLLASIKYVLILNFMMHKLDKSYLIYKLDFIFYQ